MGNAVIGIVGAGTMGAGIAHVAALAGFTVRLADVSPAHVERALARITADLEEGVTRGKVSRAAADGARANLRAADSFERFADAAFVIEAAVEDAAAKSGILARAEQAVSPSAILATNTSSLSVTALAAGLKRPAQFVGLHFFNPPHLMKLIEVVRGVKTSDATASAATALAVQFGKVPVAVRDTPGFIVNRVARPFYGEALRLLGEGVAAAEEIDRIVRLEGGFRMGPFELMDMIGIDVNFAVTKSMYERTFGEPRYRPHVIQESMVNAGLLGRKTKRGFFRYDK